MSRIVTLVVLMSVVTTGAAQTRSCRIVSARTGDGLPGAAITGLRSETSWLADSLGLVRIPSDDPGPFRVSYLGYQTRVLRPDTTASYWLIRLSPLAYALDGVEVLSPLARYRRDSAFNHTFFRRELADAGFRTKKKVIVEQTARGNELGMQWNGIFTNLALLASGKKARYKHFARELRRTEAGKYAAIRYTPGLVSEQTGMDEDSAAAFIERHPLDEAFLRQASEIELKMRVRELYRTGR